MFASTLLAAAYNMPGTPERWKALAPERAALLVEYRADDAEQLDEPERRGLEILQGASCSTAGAVLARARGDRDAVARARGACRA